MSISINQYNLNSKRLYKIIEFLYNIYTNFRIFGIDVFAMSIIREMSLSSVINQFCRDADGDIYVTVKELLNKAHVVANLTIVDYEWTQRYGGMYPCIAIYLRVNKAGTDGTITIYSTTNLAKKLPQEKVYGLGMFAGDMRMYKFLHKDVTLEDPCFDIQWFEFCKRGRQGGLIGVNAFASGIGLSIPVEETRSNWAYRPLSDTQLKYVTFDVLVHYLFAIDTLSMYRKDNDSFAQEMKDRYQKHSHMGPMFYTFNDKHYWKNEFPWRSFEIACVVWHALQWMYRLTHNRSHHRVLNKPWLFNDLVKFCTDRCLSCNGKELNFYFEYILQPIEVFETVYDRIKGHDLKVGMELIEPPSDIAHRISQFDDELDMLTEEVIADY